MKTVITSAITAIIVSIISNKSIIAYTLKKINDYEKEIENYAEQVIAMSKEAIRNAHSDQRSRD